MRDREERLNRELRDHLDRRVAALVANGMTETEARRQAAIEFGGFERVKEDCRDVRRTRWIEDLLRDVRYGFRMLTRTPVFTVVALLSLTLGIGANTAIFSLVDAVLLENLPVRDPARLVLMSERVADRNSFSLSMPAFQALSASRSLEGLCAFRPAEFRITTPAGPERIAGQLVSGRCFSVLGLQPHLGRGLGEDDDRLGAPLAAVIGHQLWTRQFGGDPAILGRQIEIQGQSATIVGVTPREFFGLEPGRQIQVSLALSSQPVVMSGVPLLKAPRARWLRLLGRLAPGTPLAAANADLDRIWRQVQIDSGAKPVNGRLELGSGAQGLNDLRREYSLPLRLLTLAVGVLLLLACANLGGLLLARARAREHEFGLRLSLGASRSRVVRQVLTESLLLSVGGSLGGLAFAYWSSGAIVSLLSRGRTPILLDLTPDLRVLGFTAVVSLATGLLLGVLPAIRAARRDPQPQIRQSDRSHTRGDRVRHALLVASQAAFSLVLVSGARLFARSLAELHRVDVGFERNHVLLIGAPGRQAIPELLSRFGQLPTVRSVTVLMDPPLGGLSWTAGFSVPGQTPLTADGPMAGFNFVGPRFLETLGIPLVEGRDFRPEDTADAAPVVIVNQSLARRYFRGQSAIGQRLDIEKTMVEIVGVAKDVRYRGIRDDASDVIYRPYVQQTTGNFGLSFAIRADMPLTSLEDLVRGQFRAVAPGLPVPSTTSLDARYDGSLTTERLMATLSAFFGAMALLLVAIGVYGTLSYGISQRGRELGVRIALGADRRAIKRLLIRAALIPVCGGLLIGLPAALAAGSLARATLFGVSFRDPIAFAGCTMLLLAVALVAAWLPARRASRLDPVAALRAE